MRDNKNIDTQTIQKFTPIICPVCGSVNLSFIAEYHKSIILKAINTLILIIGLIIIIKNITNLSDKTVQTALYVLTVIYALIYVVIFSSESRTHTKGICRDCGFIWIVE